MANNEILEEEWIELYRYLLAQLQERGLNDIRSEIEAAAAEPVIEESTPEDEARISKLVRGEVGRAIIRRRNPEEAFSAATSVLFSRLVDLPTVANAVIKHLPGSVAGIEFRVDYGQRYALSEVEPVRLEGMTTDIADAQSIGHNLAELGVAVEKRGF